MATTYTLIDSEVLTSSQASITFSSIPATYTDLVLRVSARDSSTTAYPSNLYIQVNSITSGYSFTELFSDVAYVDTQRSTGQAKYFINSSVMSDSQTSNTFSSVEVYIPNYAGSTNKKESTRTAAPQNAGTNVYDTITAQLLGNTAAITSLSITTANNFLSGSSFYLYGISNA